MGFATPLLVTMATAQSPEPSSYCGFLRTIREIL